MSTQENFSFTMETEDKYAAIALAFKTDQQTLKDRVNLHRRSLERAEDNNDRSLDELKTTLQELSPFCSDSGIRNIVAKLHEHWETLRQTSLELANKSELHGAVQQENKMAATMETMTQHVDNLKQLYEKEHSELEETRKLVDNRILQGDSELTRRSISMANATKGKRKVSTATPRLLALSGGPPSSEDEGSLPSPTLRLPGTPNSPMIAKRPIHLAVPTDKPTIPDTEEKEEIFQKGLEQGLRISVSQELGELREQQTAFCDTLESLMDKNQGPERDEESELDQFDFLDKFWAQLPAWQESLYKIRMISAALVLGLALLMLNYTLSLNSEVATKKME